MNRSGSVSDKDRGMVSVSPLTPDMNALGPRIDRLAQLLHKTLGLSSNVLAVEGKRKDRPPATEVVREPQRKRMALEPTTIMSLPVEMLELVMARAIYPSDMLLPPELVWTGDPDLFETARHHMWTVADNAIAAFNAFYGDERLRPVVSQPRMRTWCYRRWLGAPIENLDGRLDPSLALPVEQVRAFPLREPDTNPDGSLTRRWHRDFVMTMLYNTMARSDDMILARAVRLLVLVATQPFPEGMKRVRAAGLIEPTVSGEPLAAEDQLRVIQMTISAARGIDMRFSDDFGNRLKLSIPPWLARNGTTLKCFRRFGKVNPYPGRKEKRFFGLMHKGIYYDRILRDTTLEIVRFPTYHGVPYFGQLIHLGTETVHGFVVAGRTVGQMLDHSIYAIFGDTPTNSLPIAIFDRPIDLTLRRWLPKNEISEVPSLLPWSIYETEYDIADVRMWSTNATPWWHLVFLSSAKYANDGPIDTSILVRFFLRRDDMMTRDFLADLRKAPRMGEIIGMRQSQNYYVHRVGYPGEPTTTTQGTDEGADAGRWG